MWYFVFAALIAVGIAYAWWHPSERQCRKFKRELAAREALSDSEMIFQYFAKDHLASEVPARVRESFAKHTGYPVEKLRPDDDLTFFWYELDLAPLVKELESQFGIKFTSEELERTPCTIRDVSLLVASKPCRTIG